MGDMKEIFDAYKAATKERKDENYAHATVAYDQAQELAFKNGFFLHKHTHWHFSLTYKPKGYAVWRHDLYPSSQLIRIDKGPYLHVAKPWTLMDVVIAAIREAKPAPDRIVNEIEKEIGVI